MRKSGFMLRSTGIGEFLQWAEMLMEIDRERLFGAFCIGKI